MPCQRINLLSLDGGGLLGLTSLLILKRLMQRINPTNPPKPCEYFDFIGGITTGGLMAIMLDRLQLDIDECFDEYSYLMDTLMQGSTTVVTGTEKFQRRYDMIPMRNSLIEIISRCKFDKDTMFYEPNAKCKV
jgi:patatin-like phospholipase/acyl hydrolase